MKLGLLGTVNGEVTKEMLNEFALIKNVEYVTESETRFSRCEYHKTMINGEEYYIVSTLHEKEIYRRLPSVETDKLFKWERKGVRAYGYREVLRCDLYCAGFRFSCSYRPDGSGGINIESMFLNYENKNARCFKNGTVHYHIVIKEVNGNEDFLKEINNFIDEVKEVYGRIERIA